jgi:general secretion pathway protein G
MKTRLAVRAFTLIEILVVVAIVGLLAALVITNADKILGQQGGNIAKVFVRDTMKLALNRYYIDMGSFPSTAEGLGALVAAPGNAGDKWRGPYVDAPGGKLPNDPWGEPYQYRFPGTRNKGGYDLYSKGEDKSDGTADDIGNW